MPLPTSLNGQVAVQFVRPGIAKEWLTKLAVGEIMLAITLTEPKDGLHATIPSLRMERDGDHYILNSEKTSISANQIAAGTVSSPAPASPRTGRAASRRSVHGHGVHIPGKAD